MDLLADLAEAAAERLDEVSIFLPFFFRFFLKINSRVATCSLNMFAMSRAFRLLGTPVEVSCLHL
jgi:hypothetical protein